MMGSSSNSRATIKASKERMESIGKAEKEGRDSPARILVVDAEEVVCSVLQTLLIGAGHQVQSCVSAHEAIARLKEALSTWS